MNLEIFGINPVELVIGTLLSVAMGAFLSWAAQFLFHRYRVTRPLERVMGQIAIKKRLNIVYSFTPVPEYQKHDGSSVIRYDFLEKEKRVTTFYDALGIGHLHQALSLIGLKKKDYEQTTSQGLQDGKWDKNLILIGSPNSNGSTEVALALPSMPHEFRGESSITIANKATNEEWTYSPEYDYAMVSQTTMDGRTILVLAGIGPIGTAAACYYLTTHYRTIAREMGKDSGFSRVLKVSRKTDYTQCEVVDPPVAPTT